MENKQNLHIDHHSSSSLKEKGYHVTDQNLTYTLINKDQLSSAQLEIMFGLMAENYDHVSREMFVNDLSNKHYVGLIKDLDDNIQGFTTYAINPKNSGTSAYNIIFSGDTIIHPQFWGTQIMSKGWSYTIGMMIQSDPGKKWYWYLMSKGHRTYLYLPIFFKEFYPSPHDHTMENCLKQIAHEVSNKLFGNSWKRDLGVIQFEDNHGELNAQMVEATFKKKNSPYISFFLQKNPGFTKGDELVCIVPLYLNNLIRSARDYCAAGMRVDLGSIL